ncbi:MAG: phosphotransferase [Chloroflexota bacterium]|nr:phosphotransferase [Chloroflexota bacterium]
MVDSLGDGLATEIGRALRELFPDLGIAEPIHVLGSGFRSTVIEVAGEIIFRLGRNPEAEVGYARELRLLPALQPHLPITIPRPHWHAGPSPQFPFGVMGYLKVPGAPLQPEMLRHADQSSLAAQVARFLQALHRFPIERAVALGTPRRQPHGSEIQSWRDDVLPVLRGSLCREEWLRVARWWDTFLLDRSLGRYSPALIHGDLWYEHLLVDESRQRITGVLDFESAAIGDIAQDFATQRHLGMRFTNLVMGAYQAAGGGLDEGIGHRVQRLWELREFGGLAFAIRTNDEAELEDAIRKLRAGPVLRQETAGWE